MTIFLIQVSHFVRPDVRGEGDDMDIRSYVHIKKVAGGSRADTGLTHGVVFTKVRNTPLFLSIMLSFFVILKF